MSQGEPVGENKNKSMRCHLMVEGKYVKVRISKESKNVELVLDDQQGDPDSMACFPREQETKKYVGFHFTYGSECYSPKIEEGTLKLVDSSKPDKDECSFVHDWLEMENIQAGESHYLRTTAGQIGVQPVLSGPCKLCVGGSQPVIFTQVRNS